ncbi:type I 3-dehydroquinate dehydratase [Halobacteriales archaeon QS_1_68_20]|nr:MAG: type I 3-dehydroquinate dehydratase [Halobacteriales archaeon QS_1_68_20]
MDFGEFVLAASTADLADEPAAREHADAVEFRMDNRPTWEGGEADGGDGAGDPANRDRLRTLARAAERHAVEAIDVELATAREQDGRHTIEAARDHGAAVVVSSHDFEGTPGGDGLRERLDAATDAGDVGKLAVTAEDAGDVLRLLSVTLEFAQGGDRVATMAMGEAGRHSRAVAPLYGSRIGYAPVDPADATAPGQYDLATLRGLVDRLGGKPEG